MAGGKKTKSELAGVGSRSLPLPLHTYTSVPFDQLDRAINDLSRRLA